MYEKMIVEGESQISGYKDAKLDFLREHREEEGNDGTEKDERKEEDGGKGGITKLHLLRDPLTWDEYFMSIAMMSALRSKDPSTQMGACIADIHKHIVGIGYNGF